MISSYYAIILIALVGLIQWNPIELVDQVMMQAHLITQLD